MATDDKSKLDPLAIVAFAVNSERRLLLAKATMFARELANAARDLQKFVEQGDLDRVVWTVRQYDVAFAAQVESHVEHHKLVASLVDAKKEGK